MKSKKQRILVLAHSRSVGGGELALKSLIDSTKSLYDWTVVIPNIGVIDERIKSSAAQYISLPSLPWWCYEAHDQPAAIDRKKLKSSLRKLSSLAQDADILMTNTITIPWLGFIAQQAKKPHIWYVHEYGDIDHNLQFVAGYKNSLRMIAEGSSRVMTISNDVKEHIGRVIPGEKIDIIHQSVELDDLVAIPAASNFDKLSILCMGAIKPSKGQLIALEAVSKLDNVTLDIIGPSADQKYAELLEKRALEYPAISVQIRKYNPIDELSSHNVLLMCSENEGLGRVTLEALASGRLVVGYGCRSTRELLDDNRGVLYSPNNASSLRKAIDSIKITSAKVDLERARNYVVTTFSSEVQATDFSNCVDKALSVSPPSGNMLRDYIDMLDQSSAWESPLGKIKAIAKSLIPGPLKKIIKQLLSSK